MFSFPSNEEKSEVALYILLTPSAFVHLNSQCHTIFISLKGQVYFVVQCVDMSLGILKVEDQRLKAEVQSVGGETCGYGHIELVANWLAENAESKKSASRTELIEFIILGETMLALLKDSLSLQAAILAAKIAQQPEIGFPRLDENDLLN